jgi:hypothetical protein
MISPVLVIKKGIKSVVIRGISASQGLEVEVFPEWDPILEEILRAFPEDEICPHELFALLCQTRGKVAKKILLFREKGVPVALAGFRDTGYYWTPVTHYLVPGFIFPARDGYIIRSMAASGLRVNVAWWRWKSEPPQHPQIGYLRSIPTVGFDHAEDFEVFWQSVGQWKNIRKYRKRCETFRLVINEPGMTEKTIRNWGARWKPEGQPEMIDLEDRVLVATYLEKAGRCFVLTLFDNDEPTASIIWLNHRNNAVAYVNFRNPKYDWNGAMRCLIDRSFYWVREMGFEKLDLGGGFDYKEKWAPVGGTKWEFNVSPSNITLKGYASDLLQKARKHLNSFVKAESIRLQALTHQQGRRRS